MPNTSSVKWRRREIVPIDTIADAWNIALLKDILSNSASSSFSKMTSPPVNSILSLVYLVPLHKDPVGSADVSMLTMMFPTIMYGSGYTMGILF